MSNQAARFLQEGAGLGYRYPLQGGDVAAGAQVDLGAETVILVEGPV